MTTQIIQPIIVGTYANDGTGDDLRTAFQKVNANFSLLSTEVGIANAVNLGTGVGIWADKNLTNLEFKSLTSTGNTVAITSTGTTVNLESTSKLLSDTAPTLGAALNLNGNFIYGGDTETTVYGSDVRISNSLLSVLLNTNNLTVDLGSYTNPTGYEISNSGYNIDFGSGFSKPKNELNFGKYGSALIQDGSNHQITLGGNLTTAGGYNLVMNLAGNTNITLPTSGTLLTTTFNLGQLATGSTSSTQLANLISDETGSGQLVFGTGPTINSPNITGHITVEGTTSTGATGTGSVVFGTSPSLSSPTITGTASITGSSITTTSATMSLFDTNATTVSAFSAATIINLGSSGGTILVGSTGTGTITAVAATATTASTAASVGYMGMPQQSKSSAYTTVIGDAGKHIYVTATATITIDSNVNVPYPIGTAIAFIAAAGATVTIAITSDTMYLGGTGTTGSRTLAAFGMATAVKVTRTAWVITGTGLT
jgi:hypothetical protein